MSNTHDHNRPRSAYFASDGIAQKGRSVIAHSEKSAHTNRTRGRSGEKIAEPQYGERDDGYKNCPPS